MNAQTFVTQQRPDDPGLETPRRNPHGFYRHLPNLEGSSLGEFSF